MPRGRPSLRRLQAQAIEILDPRRALAVTAEDERAEDPQDRRHPGSGADLAAGGIQILQGLGRAPRGDLAGAAATASPQSRRWRPSRGAEESPISMPASGGADALVQAQQPEPGQVVGRVVEQADGGGEVLHVRRLHEAKAAVLPVRHPASRELELDEVAVVGRPHEYGLIPQPHPLFVGIEDAVDDGARLARGVVATDEHRPAAARPVAVQCRGAPLPRAGRTMLARSRMGCTRPEVALERR